jgi:hypothetical protein
VRSSVVLILFGVLAVAGAGCGGGSSSGNSKPKGDPQVVAERFMHNILTGYLDPAEQDLSPISGVDPRSLTNISIGLQSGHFRVVGKPKKTSKTYNFTLAGELRNKPIRLVYAVGVGPDVGGWRIVGFRLVKDAAPT